MAIRFAELNSADYAGFEFPTSTLLGGFERRIRDVETKWSLGLIDARGRAGGLFVGIFETDNVTPESADNDSRY